MVLVGPAEEVVESAPFGHQVAEDAVRGRLLWRGLLRRGLLGSGGGDGDGILRVLVVFLLLGGILGRSLVVLGGEVDDVFDLVWGYVR